MYQATYQGPRVSVGNLPLRVNGKCAVCRKGRLAYPTLYLGESEVDFSFYRQGDLFAWMGFVGRLLQDVSWASGKLLGWGTKRTCLYVSYLPPNAREGFLRFISTGVHTQ